MHPALNCGELWRTHRGGYGAMNSGHISRQATRGVAGLSLIGMLIVSAAAHAAPAGSDLSATAWSAYHSAAGRFSLAVPTDWSAVDSLDAFGVPTLTLTSPDGAQGISVRTAPVSADDGVDLPNQMCTPLLTGGLVGTRCVDTLSRALVVTLSGPAATFQFVSGLRGDPSIFDQVLASFAPDTAAADANDASTAPAQVAPSATSPEPDICASRTTPISKANPLCPAP